MGALCTCVHESSMLYLVYLICVAWRLLTELTNAWNLCHGKTTQPDGIRHAFCKLLVLSICVWCSSDWLLHQPVQAALCASALAKSMWDKAQTQWRINFSLNDGTVLALKACIWVLVMENYHTIRPLWVEIWSLHAVILTCSSIELLWGSFNVWYLQRLLCGANVADALLEEKRYAGPGVFGKGCDEVTWFLDMSVFVDSRAWLL